MIILRIPRKVNGKDLREFILNQVKKFKRNQKRKHIKLEGEIAYSQEYVYFIFPNHGLELSFALSILIKCREHTISCTLELSRPIIIEQLDKEIVKCAEQWSKHKLWRKCYKLKEITIHSST